MGLEIPQRIVGIMSIELPERETDFLLEVLASAERELLGEISRTDTRSYRDKLEDRLNILEDVRAKLTVGALYEIPGPS